MSFSECITTALPSIVAKASPLSERFNNSLTPNATNNDDTQIEARLQLWCQVVAKGNSAKFQRRLAYDGLNIDTLHPLLGDACQNEDQPLPLWATTLGQVIQTAQTISLPQLFSPHRYLDPEDPVPFETIYIPCLQVAQQKFQVLASSHSQLLNETAQITLERSLLQYLASISAWTLFQDFSEFRSSGNLLRDFLLLRIQGGDSQEKYHAFIQKLFQDGLLSLFQNYSVLGRLVATAIDFWVEATAEFLNRLATDWLEIQQCFSEDTPLEQVIALKPNLSDSHNRGRSVIALTFNTGLQLVYKPKDLGLDVVFYQLLDWCNQHGNSSSLFSPRLPGTQGDTPLAFKILQVLNRSTHGWVEYVESQPCEDEAAVQRFYQRSGMLLCLVYALQGTDCHYENLIASGEHPVLVDLETLLHHRLKTVGSIKSDAPTLAYQQLSESVLQTHLLPQWGILLHDPLSIDLSGLGGVEEQQQSVPKLENLNMDAMALSYKTVSFKQANAPTLNGTPLSPEDYLEDLVAGMTQMYRLLMSQKAELFAPDSPLMFLAHQNVRFVFRATNTYAVILQKSFQPSLLGTGIDRSIGLDVLSRGFLTMEEKPIFWQMLAAEVQAMEQLDIPFFPADSSSHSLKLPTGVLIPEVFEEPSFDRMLRRLATLSEADLTQQIEIIWGSFYSRFIQEPSPVSGEVSPVPCLRVTEVVTSEQLVQQAITIAEDLQQRAICATDGSVTWIGMGYRHRNQGFQLQGLGYSLYDGSCGVALFLAALAKITGDSQWHELALGTLQPLRHALADSEPDSVARLTRQLGISGTTGLGSIVYALTKISQLLQESALLADARTAASWITPDKIAADQTFDVMEGAAGVILSLLSLHEVETGNQGQQPTPLEFAIAWGEHLLEHQTSIDHRPKTWKTGNGKQLTGFSQGAAGIAYALLRLFAVTQDCRFLNAATDAIAYEQSVFSTEAQNWLDLRSEEPCFRVSWAHGASGIGLGRLGGLSVLDTVEIRQEIAIALETTQKYILGNVNNLCWGTLGRIETLLVAAQRLNRPDLLEFVDQAVTWILAQAQQQGCCISCSDLPSKVYNPGFFHGATGIGYQLLRIANPQLLSSVLLWQ